MEYGSINMKFWKPHVDVKSRSRVLIIGGSNTGKSTVTEHLMYLHKNIPDWVVISGSESFNPRFSKRLPACFIHFAYSDDLLHKIISEREAYVKRIVDKYKHRVPSDVDDLKDWLFDNGYLKPMGLVIDDQGAVADLQRSKLFAQFVTVSRHLQMLLLVCQHHTKGLAPTARDSFDYVIACREPSRVIRKNLYHQFFGNFEDEKQFNKTFDMCSGNYEVLVARKRVQSNNINDVMRYWKADIDIVKSDFKCGSRKSWDYYRNVYKPKETSGSSFDIFMKQPVKKKQATIQKEF